MLASVIGLLGAAAPAYAADTCDQHRTYNTTITTEHGARTQHHTYETTLSTSEVRVFRQRGLINSVTYVCARTNSRVQRLGVATGAGAAASDVFIMDVLARGSIVGFDTKTRGDVNRDRFRAVDARTGHVVADSGNVANQPGADEPEFAMARSGALAWIVAGTAGVADSHGSRVVSTPGAGPATALAVGTSTAYFTQDATPHAVALS